MGSSGWESAAVGSSGWESAAVGSSGWESAAVGSRHRQSDDFVPMEPGNPEDPGKV